MQSRMKSSSTFYHVPPGFRFHPTDEELVDYYLRKKISSRRIDLDVIKDLDLYKIEPWDLQESEEQHEWYFFSHKDKKYPTGTRANRATTAGFWKATGRDKSIYTRHELIGMRKTLVFYKGRAPNGQKSNWIMHEYRLETDDNVAPQDEGWVVCRVFKKKLTTRRKISDDQDSSLCLFDDQLDSPNQSTHSQPPPDHLPAPYIDHRHGFPYCTTTTCKKEQMVSEDLLFPMPPPHDPNQYFLQLPLLQSPKPLLPTPSSYGLDMNTSQPAHHHRQSLRSIFGNGMDGGDCDLHDQQQQAGVVDSLTDWRVLDKFVASQLSHES